MQSKQLAPILYWNPPALAADWIASSTATVSLPTPLNALPLGRASEGDVVLVKVQEVNQAYPVLETPSGQEIILQGGELLVGVLGSRRALKGFSGRVPAQLRPHSTLHLLNKGGVIGECTAFHRDLGWPTAVTYVGTVSRQGRAFNLKDEALPLIESPLPEVPLITVLGTCMNAGKTTVCKQIIRLFSARGFQVHAGKAAGVACLRDTLGMKSNGARKVLSFHDFGLPSTAELDDLSALTRSLLHHLSRPQPDLIVLEMGDGILGGYHVASLFADTQFMDRNLCTILCANDLMGVWGGIEWMRRQGRSPALICGPVTDSAEGIQYIEDNWHIPAANVFDGAGKIATLILGSLMPWLKSA